MTAQVVPLGKAAPIAVAHGGQVGSQDGAKHRSTDAHVQYWTGIDIPREIQGSKLVEAYQIWHTASANGIPRLRDITNSNAPGAVNNTMLLLKMNDDYLVVAQGVDYIRSLGRDLRGLLMSEFKKPTTVVMKELYDKCLAERQAIYTRFVSDLSRQSIYWEGLFIPLRADENRQPIFVKNYMMPVDDRADILQMILDSAPVGMVAAIPFGGGEGDTQDGRIIIVNARAKEILKLDDSNNHIHYIRDLTPWLRDKLGWKKTSMTTDKLQTRVQYRDEANYTYLVTIEPLMRFVLFSLFQLKDGGLSKPDPGPLEIFR
jgi:PAS domain-containing protein